jgi:hypothetical protein
MPYLDAIGVSADWLLRRTAPLKGLKRAPLKKGELSRRFVSGVVWAAEIPVSLYGNFYEKDG